MTTSAARRNSVANHWGHQRGSAFPMLVFGVFLSGCTTLPPAADFFEQHEIVTGAANRQTVLTGRLLGGAVADLAVITLDEDDDPRLCIYAFGDGTWAPTLEAALGPGVSFVDVVNIGGRDRLVTYEPEGLNWFDPESATKRALIAVTCDFDPPHKGAILHVDVTRDVNHDDRDDLVVPHDHGFRVFVQRSDGTFADPVKLGPSTGLGRIYGADGYRYDPWMQGGRVHEVDYDLDGRSDLVFWNEDHFEAHLQDEHGLFAPTAITFSTEVAFDTDELASLAAPGGFRHRQMDHMPAGDLAGRVLHTLTDMNGDGIADLVVFSLEGEDLWHMHSTYEVHFGAPTPDGTEFATEIGTAIRRDGIIFGMDRHDFEHDGQVDMMFTLIDPNPFSAIGMIIGAMLTHYVTLDLELFCMDDGVYPDRPNATRTIKAQTPRGSEEQTFFPSVLVGDVNGDGRSDLLVQNGRKELRRFAGVPGPDVVARRPQRMAVAMPADEEYTWLVDLNRDGKQDVLMHHPSPTEPHRVTVLIAR